MNRIRGDRPSVGSWRAPAPCRPAFARARSLRADVGDTRLDDLDEIVGVDQQRVTAVARAAQDPLVLEALKRYGMMLADNGSDWFITGAPDPRWNNDQLRTLRRVTGRNFEVVDTRSLRAGG